LQHVDRAKNEEADALAKAAARGEALPSDVFYHVIGTLAVRSLEGLQITNDTEGHRIVNLIMTEDWRAPITLFLQGYYHPSDINEAKRLKHRSRDFALIEGQLYKKGVSQPILKCVTETEGIQILCEVHNGTCGSHAGPRALAAKVIRQGFYWPAMICAANRVTRSAPRIGSPRTSTSAVLDVDEPTSNNLIDGDRVFALQALNKYQAQTKAWRDHTVVPREFNEGDLVLVRTARTESRGKLEPKWEGPFIVKTKSSPSVYRLTTPSSEDLEHSWNIDNLRKFFV
jgi:hypothetical protein